MENQKLIHNGRDKLGLEDFHYIYDNIYTKGYEA